jgi:hypothetical protein
VETHLIRALRQASQAVTYIAMADSRDEMGDSEFRWY